MTELHQLLGAQEAHRVERIQSLWSGYGEIVRYRLVGGPVATVVVKHVRPPARPRHPRGWSGEAGHARKLRSYEVELAWYRDWAQRCPSECRVPRVHHASPGFFVLEDLDASGFPGRTRHLSDAQLEACLIWLAAFHQTFLHQPPTGLWDRGTYWNLSTRADELEQMEDGPLERAASPIDRHLWDVQHRTLVHGDAKAANFCFGATAAAVDFQYVGAGIGVQDVAYLLGGLDDTRLHRDHDRWIDRYFALLDRPDAEAEWRPLIPFAWADFERFLAGWAPEHHKRTSFAARLTEQALATIRESDQWGR